MVERPQARFPDTVIVIPLLLLWAEFFTWHVLLLRLKVQKSRRTVFSAGLWVLQGLLFDNVSCIVVDVFLLDAAWNKLSESGCIVFSFLTFVLG